MPKIMNAHAIEVRCLPYGGPRPFQIGTWRSYPVAGNQVPVALDPRQTR